MGVQGGVDQLQWLFTATFFAMLLVVPLFGWLCANYSRKQFLPFVYYFFAGNLLIFFILLHYKIYPILVARLFFVWVSVFNLFVVSVFWSLMVDVFSNEQSKRLFGIIAAGGSLGAICGPAVTSVLAVPLGSSNLLLLSAAILIFAVLCMKRIIAWFDSETNSQHIAVAEASDFIQDKPMAGSIFGGIKLVLQSPYLMGICVLMLLFTTLSTFLYFQQAQIIKDAFIDSGQRTAVFAGIDLAVNSLTLLFQVLLTGRIVAYFGLSWALATVPLALAIGFAALGLAPGLIVLVLVQVFRRAGNYAMMRPAREMLYVVLDRESKYKAKNFIDTTVYRGGDAISSWVYTGLKAAGLSLPYIAFIAAPLALIWAWVAYGMGRWQSKINAGEIGVRNIEVRNEKQN